MPESSRVPQAPLLVVIVCVYVGVRCVSIRIYVCAEVGNVCKSRECVCLFRMGNMSVRRCRGVSICLCVCAELDVCICVWVRSLCKCTCKGKKGVNSG